jgi:hypothetical protein
MARIPSAERLAENNPLQALWTTRLIPIHPSANVTGLDCSADRPLELIMPPMDGFVMNCLYFTG